MQKQVGHYQSDLLLDYFSKKNVRLQLVYIHTIYAVFLN